MSEKLCFKKGDWVEFTHNKSGGLTTGLIESEERYDGFNHPFYKVDCYLGLRAVGKAVISERNYRIRPSEKRFTFDNLLSVFTED